MQKKPVRWNPKRVLRLPDLNHAKTAVVVDHSAKP
jgi:hypothetical protein